MCICLTYSINEIVEWLRNDSPDVETSRCLPAFKLFQKSRVFAEIELTMSSGLKMWCTSSSDDGLAMADFKRACSEIKEGIY